MGELSDRFAGLMARMAKSDAELFRTIGEQNASVRQMVDEITTPDPETPVQSSAAVLPGASLLPPEECELKALKARFGKLVDAQTWLESRIGKAPKKPTWAVVEQTCRNGSWPASASLSKAPAAKAITAAQLDDRLASLERRLEQRLQTMETMLHLIAEAVIHGR